MRCDKWMRVSFIAALIVLLAASTGLAMQESRKESKKAKAELPAAVAKAVKEFRPNAEIDKLEVEKEAGVTLYDIEFKAGQGEIEVAADGTVMDVATIIEMKDVPKPAADAINKAAAGAKIAQLEKSEVRAEIKKEGEKGKVVRLATPRYVYEAELVKGKQKGEIQVSPEGKIVEALKWGAEGEKEKK